MFADGRCCRPLNYTTAAVQEVQAGVELGVAQITGIATVVIVRQNYVQNLVRKKKLTFRQMIREVLCRKAGTLQ